MLASQLFVIALSICVVVANSEGSNCELPDDSSTMGEHVFLQHRDTQPPLSGDASNQKLMSEDPADPTLPDTQRPLSGDAINQELMSEDPADPTLPDTQQSLSGDASNLELMGEDPAEPTLPWKSDSLKEECLNRRPMAKNEVTDNESRRFKESAMAHKWLDGLVGLEIGSSAHNAFGLNTTNVDYTADTTEWKQAELQLDSVFRRVDVVAPGNHLPFQDASFDFVINAHVLEHFYDPIEALQEWIRVVKPGGYVFVILPHKERTRDKKKERTPLSEIIARHAGPPIDPAKDPHQHWNIWTTQDLLDLCEHMELKVVDSRDKDDKVGNGFTVVIQKK